MAADAPAASTIAIRLARELHRRNTRFCSDPPEWTEGTRMQAHGELLGLQVSLGIALGHTATGDDGLKAAASFYQRWLAAGTPEVLPP